MGKDRANNNYQMDRLVVAQIKPKQIGLIMQGMQATRLGSQETHSRPNSNTTANKGFKNNHSRD